MINYQLLKSNFKEYQQRKDLAYKLARIVDFSSEEIKLTEENDKELGLVWYIDRYNQWKINFPGDTDDEFHLTYCQLDKIIEAETALDHWLRYNINDLKKISYSLDPNIIEFGHPI